MLRYLAIDYHCLSSVVEEARDPSVGIFAYSIMIEFMYKEAMVYPVKTMAKSITMTSVVGPLVVETYSTNSRSCVLHERYLRKPCCSGARTLLVPRWCMVALVMICSRILHGMLVRDIGR